MPFALASVSHHANTVILNGTIGFLRLRQVKWNAFMTVFVMWFHWHQCWHHMVPLALALLSCNANPLVSPSCDVDSSINGTNAFLRSRWSKMRFSKTSMVMWHYSASHGSFDTNSFVKCITAFLWSRQSKRGTMWLFCNLMPLVLAWVWYAANSIINDTTTFLRLRHPKEV